ncbi:hypothetical protein Tco_0766779 [Tanacetum coccineum]
MSQNTNEQVYFTNLLNPNPSYKHLEHKSGENETDHIEAAKINFAAQQPKGRKFMLEHAEFKPLMNFMAAAMKHMASNFAKLDKFEGVDFKRWQNKMHFSLSSMSVVYVLTTPMLEDGDDNPTVEQNVETSKELWDTLEAKCMAEDASSKKFLVSNFTNYKMNNSRLVLKQYNKLLGILGRFTQHRMNMDESIQDNDNPKGNNVAGPSIVNMVEHNNSSMYNDNKGKRKLHDTKSDPNKKPKVTCWKCRKPIHLKKDCKAGNVGNKANGSGTKGLVDGSSNSLKGQNMFNKSLQVYYVTYVSESYFVQDDDVAWWVDSGAIVHVYKDR